MCDVTDDNFHEIFPKIKEYIEKAAFIAIDGEFTGLSTNVIYEPTLFDTPEARYEKLRQSLSRFTLCQCGLSIFVCDRERKNRYTAHTFNFYIFPRSFGPVDSRFTCQASCLEFLSLHDFDFNKFIKHGVPYLNTDQLRELEKHHRNGDVLKHAFSQIRQLDEDYVSSALPRIENFEKDTDSPCIVIDKIPRGLAQYLFVQSIERRSSGLACHLHNDGKITISKNLEEKFDYEQQYRKIFEYAHGFSRIIDLLIQHKKPVVGHNCLSDLIFIFEKFCANLPERYCDFKGSIDERFPLFYDTKHIAFNMRREFKQVDFFDDTCLQDLFTSLTSSSAQGYKLQSPWIVHGPESKKYETITLPHEAGYDAYMTGCVFLQMTHLLACKSIPSMDSRVMLFEEYIQSVEDFQCQVNLPRAAARYINFKGDDPAVVPPEQFLVYSKGKKISTAQVAQDFLAFGSVDVQLLDRTCVLVAVSQRKRGRDVVKAFSKHKRYKVSRYTRFHLSKTTKKILYCGVFITGTLTIASIIWTITKP